MVRSAGSWSQLSSPLLYLSEINNYWFSSTRLFLMRQTHLQQDQGNRPETHQLSHHIVQMAVINLHWCANTPGVDFLKFPGYCCELHQQEKIAISTLWLKWVKQERKKAGIEPTVGQEGPARLMQLSLRDGRTLCWSPAAHHWTVLQAASTRWRWLHYNNSVHVERRHQSNNGQPVPPPTRLQFYDKTYITRRWNKINEELYLNDHCH